jgi:hypothetical protein
MSAIACPTVAQAPFDPMPQQAVASFPVAPSTVMVSPLASAAQHVAAPRSQKPPLMQLVASLQLLMQAVAPQMNGVQSVVPCGWQAPAPSQVVGLVWVVPVQLAGAPQAVRMLGNAQAPKLSQSLAPQVGSLVSQTAVQQCPFPRMPQMPVVQASLVVQGPVAT